MRDNDPMNEQHNTIIMPKTRIETSTGEVFEVDSVTDWIRGYDCGYHVNRKLGQALFAFLGFGAGFVVGLIAVTQGWAY